MRTVLSSQMVPRSSLVKSLLVPFLQQREAENGFPAFSAVHARRSGTKVVTALFPVNWESRGQLVGFAEGPERGWGPV